MMVSPHYPFLSAHPQSWLVVALIIVAGALIRHFINRVDAGEDVARVRLDAAGRGLRADLRDLADRAARAGATGAAVSDTEVLALTAKHCAICHARKPTHESFKEAPKNVMLEFDRGPAQIRAADPDPDGAEQGDAARQPDRHDRRGAAKARPVDRGAALRRGCAPAQSCTEFRSHRPSQVNAGNGVNASSRAARTTRKSQVDHHGAQDPVAQRRVGLTVVGRPGEPLFPNGLRNSGRPDPLQRQPCPIGGNPALARESHWSSRDAFSARGTLDDGSDRAISRQAGSAIPRDTHTRS